VKHEIITVHIDIGFVLVPDLHVYVTMNKQLGSQFGYLRGYAWVRTGMY
jgi:hypothetical protein